MFSKAKSGSKNHKAPNNQPSSGGNHKGNDNPPRTGYSSKHSKGFKPSNGSRSGSHFNRKDSHPQPGPSGSSSNNWNKSKPPNKRPELSEKEKERWKTEGLCFHCGKSGHMVTSVPRWKMVKHGKGTSPPGFASANVNINLEQLRELTETTEDLHELKVGMINTWLDSLEVGPNIYESEDESPHTTYGGRIRATWKQRVNLPMLIPVLHLDMVAVHVKTPHPRESCSDSMNIEGIWAVNERGYWTKD